MSTKAVSDKLFSAAIDCITLSSRNDSRITTAAGLPENNLLAKAST
jgi:hypothetical protein